jgi:hypothetical protein
MRDNITTGIGKFESDLIGLITRERRRRKYGLFMVLWHVAAVMDKLQKSETHSWKLVPNKQPEKRNAE